MRGRAVGRARASGAAGAAAAAAAAVALGRIETMRPSTIFLAGGAPTLPSEPTWRGSAACGAGDLLEPHRYNALPWKEFVDIKLDARNLIEVFQFDRRQAIQSIQVLK